MPETETTNLESPAFFNVRNDTMPDAVQEMAGQPDNGLLTPTGLFSKLIDTAGDIFAQRQSSNNQQPLVGTVYPTGQNNPDTVRQDAVANGNPATISPASNAAAQFFQYMPYIVGGIVVIVVAALAFRARGK